MTIVHPTTLSLPHALDRFLERCLPIIRNRDRDACERWLRTLMTRMVYRDGTWDKSALDGLGQGIFEVDINDDAGVFVVVGTVDGAGMLRTINRLEEY